MQKIININYGKYYGLWKILWFMENTMVYGKYYD
jgi:hypothetical protein